MKPLVVTWLLPGLFDPAELRGGAAIIIDQLRASTTICAALTAGARAIRPCLQPDEAIRLRDEMVAGGCLCGGERGGLKIDGFDLGNSPGEYTRERIGGLTVAFTTTNGTRALLRAGEARAVAIGCLGNAGAVAAWAAGAACRTVHLVCAGTRERVTYEDVIAAGAIAERLEKAGCAVNAPDAREDDDSTRIARDLWRSVSATPGGVLGALRGSRGGRNLERIGLGDDVVECAEIDRYATVPVLDRADGMLKKGR